MYLIYTTVTLYHLLIFFNSLLSLPFKKNMKAKFVSAGSAEIFAKTRKYFITSAVQMYSTVCLKQLQFVLNKSEFAL